MAAATARTLGTLPAAVTFASTSRVPGTEGDRGPRVESRAGDPAAVEEDLAIKDVAERTGIAAGTIRMWEQRHGFPAPQRTTAGYRRYTPEDVETLRRIQAYRDRGLSVAAASERARETGGPSDRPSLYAAVAAGDHGARPQVLRKATLERL